MISLGTRMPAGNNTNSLSSQKTRNASQSNFKVLSGSGPIEDRITEAADATDVNVCK